MSTIKVSDVQKLHVVAYALFTQMSVTYRQYILTDFINALPGNSIVYTVQHATVEEAVFSVCAVTSQQWIVIT
jgi:hypothetical protein